MQTLIIGAGLTGLSAARKRKILPCTLRFWRPDAMSAVKPKPSHLVAKAAVHCLNQGYDAAVASGKKVAEYVTRQSRQAQLANM